MTGEAVAATGSEEGPAGSLLVAMATGADDAAVVPVAQVGAVVIGGARGVTDVADAVEAAVGVAGAGAVVGKDDRDSGPCAGQTVNVAAAQHQQVTDLTQVAVVAVRIVTIEAEAAAVACRMRGGEVETVHLHGGGLVARAWVPAAAAGAVADETV